MSCDTTESIRRCTITYHERGSGWQVARVALPGQVGLYPITRIFRLTTGRVLYTDERGAWKQVPEDQVDAEMRRMARVLYPDYDLAA